jgi:hypothetical protein
LAYIWKHNGITLWFETSPIHFRDNLEAAHYIRSREGSLEICVLSSILCIPGIQYTDLKTIMASDPGSDVGLSNFIEFKNIKIPYVIIYNSIYNPTDIIAEL